MCERFFQKLIDYPQNRIDRHALRDIVKEKLDDCIKFTAEEMRVYLGKDTVISLIDEICKEYGSTVEFRKNQHNMY